MSSSSNDEFSKIRGEFMSLMKDVNLDAQVEAARRDTKEELTHAYTELDRLHKKLLKEKDSRSQIERELQSLKRISIDNSNVENNVEKNVTNNVTTNLTTNVTSNVTTNETQKKTSSEAIKRKTLELEALRKERDSVSEWLERGKEENIRLTNEENESHTELESAEARCARLSAEKNRLTSQLKQLTEDLTSLRNDIETIEEEKEILTTKLSECSAKALTFEKRNTEVEGNLSEIKEECKKLHQRVQELGDYEGSLVDMCNSMADLIDNVSELNRAISDGRLEGTAPSLNQRIKDQRVARFANTNTSLISSSSLSPYRREASVLSNTYGDTEQDQETFNALHGTEKPSVVGDNTIVHTGSNQGGPSIEDARQLLQTLFDGITSLNDTVYYFVKEKQRTFLEVQRIQQDDLAAIQRDKELMIQQHERDKEELHYSACDSQREIAEAAAKLDVYNKKVFERREEMRLSGSDGLNLQRPSGNWTDDVDKEADEDVARRSAEEMMNLFESLDKTHKELEDIQHAISLSQSKNKRLRSQASGRKIDWVKVNESRHRYQQLMIEVEMMKDYQKRLEAENAHLETVVALHHQRAAETPEQAAARRHSENQRRKISKLAFDEWKRNLLGGACCEEEDSPVTMSPLHTLQLMNDGDELDGIYA